MPRKKVKKTLEEITQEKLELSRPTLDMSFQSEDDSQEIKTMFSDFWAAERKKYNRSKDLEEILWLHLKAIEHDKPELFEAGILNFGLKKIE